MALNWEFEGFGDMYCYADGKLYNNMGDYQCRSPAQIRIPDRYNHTFRVALQVRESLTLYCLYMLFVEVRLQPQHICSEPTCSSRWAKPSILYCVLTVMLTVNAGRVQQYFRCRRRVRHLGI